MRWRSSEPGTWAEFRPDGSPPGRGLLGGGRGRRGCGRGATGRPGRGHRDLGGCASGGGRARRDLPVGRARLEHHLRPGQAGQPRSRGLHDHVPSGGPPPGGDARRRRVRTEGGAPARHPPPRDPDSPRRRQPSAAHRRHSRRAHRGSRRDQHTPHVRGGTRRRCQGPAVGNGSGRALRWVPQAPGLHRGGPVPAPARCRPPRRRCRGGPHPGDRRGAGTALRALGQAVPHLLAAARRGRLPPQLHAVRPRRAGGPGEPGPRRPGGTR